MNIITMFRFCLVLFGVALSAQCVEIGTTFIVVLDKVCNRECRIHLYKAASRANCHGCQLSTLGDTAIGHESFTKVKCTKGGAAKAKVLKEMFQMEGLPVKYVEEDFEGIVQGFRAVELKPVERASSGLIWNIDEMDGRAQDGQRCRYSLLGDAVIVVVLDTGCTASPAALEYDEIRCKNYAGGNVSPPCRDGNGHGTHVAGIITNKNHGVAPFAHLSCMRVLNDQGRGSFSNFIRAINDVAKFAVKTWMPIVVNLSLAGPKSAALNEAVKAAAKAGVYVAVASGNFNKDASNFSPAAATDNERIFAVGAHDSNGNKAGFSDFGKLVQLTGPGVNIESDSRTGGTSRLSGTSMASPHVAGAMACLLSDGFKPTLKLLQAKTTVKYPGAKVHKAKYPCDLFM